MFQKKVAEEHLEKKSNNDLQISRRRIFSNIYSSFDKLVDPPEVAAASFINLPPTLDLFLPVRTFPLAR